MAKKTRRKVLRAFRVNGSVSSTDRESGFFGGTWSDLYSTYCPLRSERKARHEIGRARCRISPRILSWIVWLFVFLWSAITMVSVLTLQQYYSNSIHIKENDNHHNTTRPIHIQENDNHNSTTTRPIDSLPAAPDDMIERILIKSGLGHQGQPKYPRLSKQKSLTNQSPRTFKRPGSVHLQPTDAPDRKDKIKTFELLGGHYRGVLAFLHIGKAGGTSFDKVGAAIAQEKQYFYDGQHHFDWSEIDKVKVWRDNMPVEVVTLLREPVARAVSHFYFWKSQAFQEGSKMVNQTLAEYLFEGNQQNLLETRDIWQDGQAGVSWLTGTHIGSWVVPGITTEMVEERELRSLNTTMMLHLAAARLRETKWFGLMEDLPRSMALLKYAFIPSKVPPMPTKNQHTNNIPPMSEQEHQALASLMPQDMWLYEYAKLLFEARWHAFQTGGFFVEPPEPPFPKVLPCTSTRFKLECTAGPLAQFYSP